MPNNRDEHLPDRLSQKKPDRNRVKGRKARRLESIGYKVRMAPENLKSVIMPVVLILESLESISKHRKYAIFKVRAESVVTGSYLTLENCGTSLLFQTLLLLLCSEGG